MGDSWVKDVRGKNSTGVTRPAPPHAPEDSCLLLDGSFILCEPGSKLLEDLRSDFKNSRSETAGERQCVRTETQP